MKTWNAPVISELNINETANGFFNFVFETRVLFNDDFKCTPPDDPDQTS